MFHANNFPLNYKITFKEKYGNPECDKKHKKNRCIAATIL